MGKKDTFTSSFVTLACPESSLKTLRRFWSCFAPQNDARLRFFLTIIFCCIAGFVLTQKVNAQFLPTAGSPAGQPYVTPEPCRSGQGTRPASQYPGSYCPDLSRADPNYQNNQDLNNDYTKSCAQSYEEWTADKTRNFWVTDPEITALGKGGERSRQFLLWTLTHPSLDTSKPILDIWKFSRNIAWFMLLIVAIVMGVGIIVGQRNNFELRIEVSPLIMRLAILILYVTFSAGIILLIMQIADVLMEFFIKTLGVRELFNIFFVSDQSGEVVKVSERAYREFVGCTNWNINNWEMVRTSKFLVRFTNMTYYFLGIMLILRKVVLWFLLMVSPFLAILAPFIFIRNVGWIWIGVFFQWVFYGPLFALFLGGLAKIWNSATFIPYLFDFSRTHKLSEVVYPTSINILYGGPAQQLAIWNTSNYVDTFAEYVIALIMLWTVLILPWWLLRIFRDYCCDGIYAMKNILLSMYDQAKGTPPGPTPGPISPTGTSSTGQALKIPQKIEQDIQSKIKIENIQEIKRAHTEEIVQSMQMKATTITDIAKMETVRETRETTRKTIDYLKNPLKAETPTERQKFLHIRNELMDRALKGDTQAKQALTMVSDRRESQIAERERILSSLPKMTPVVHTIAVKVKIATEKTNNILQKVVTQIAADNTNISTIAQEAKVDAPQAQKVLAEVSTTENLQKTAPDMVSTIAQKTGVEEKKVRAVITKTAVVASSKKDLIAKVAAEEQVSPDTVKQIVEAQTPAVSNIEDSVSIPPTVKIEEYEQVKDMWLEQYEKGEIPVSENITDRTQWVDTDIVALSNILNKILSSDAKLKAAGLEEVGYVLPIFMINNMKGEELAVYLKAKLEAAKQVKKDIEKEKEIEAKVKSKEEEILVDIDRPKTEQAEKTMTMSLEQEVPESAGSATSAGSAGSEKSVSSSQGSVVSSQDVDKVEEIKDKLQEKADESPNDIK